MLLFFGTRATVIKKKHLQGNYQCSYCDTPNSYWATTYGRYFHFFWIPIIPLYKTTILECTHCKKTYAQNELPENLKQVLKRSHELDPPKRPFWHGIGCLILVLLFVVPFIISIFVHGFGGGDGKAPISDSRKIALQKDLKAINIHPTQATDSISFQLKECVDQSIEGIDLDKVGYFSKMNNSKLLVLLKVGDMKKIRKNSRKELVAVVEECLNTFIDTETYPTYIGVDGKWSMLLIKTPTDSDLIGAYANKDLLLPFYGEKALEVKSDTLQIK